MPDKQQPTPYAQIFSDQAVSGEKGLDFQFGGMAKTLAELAWNPNNQTPFTAVVRGGWGRGKTTLLRQTKRLLDLAEKEPDRRRVRTVWFNAWKYPNEDTVLAGLLGALLDEFRQGDMLDQLRFYVDSHKHRLARTVLHAAAPWAFAKPAEDKAWLGRYDAIEQKRAFNDLFRNLFVQASYLLFHGSAAVKDTSGRRPEDLWDAQAQKKHALAIFLDDLDRCRQERVLEVLEAINLFLDLPGVCFFMGLDSERLMALLPEHLAGHKEEFLEKIVQISLDLPDISEEGASGYVGRLIAGTPLHQILKGDDIGVIAQVLGSRHPRHVKRFLNDLSMTLALLRNTDRLGANPPRLPERAVVAWHLLREGLPSEKWREVRALTVNLDGFLRQWLAAAESEVKETRQEEWGKALMALHQAGALHTHVEVLNELDLQQKDTLVHFGSPPRELPTRETRKPDISRVDSGKIEWVDIPAGVFQMGSNDAEKDEKPVHDVELSGFQISKYPITNAQYAEYVRATDSSPPRHWQEGGIPEGKENHPVVYVSWEDAVGYCRWLNEELKQRERGKVGLPTEAQWEYAARGAQGREYPWGDDEPDPQRCNFARNVRDTTPVSAYPKGATPDGVYDLAGNVYEWCRDWYGPYDAKKGHKDPHGPKTGQSRVLRGGAFSGDRRGVRCAYRDSGDPDSRYSSLGFRVVLSP